MTQCSNWTGDSRMTMQCHRQAAVGSLCTICAAAKRRGERKTAAYVAADKARWDRRDELHRLRTAVIDAAKAWYEIGPDADVVDDFAADTALIAAVHALLKAEES